MNLVPKPTLIIITLLCSVGADIYGQLAFSPGNRYATGFAPQGVAIGDLNGNGKPDVVVANYLGASLSVLTNKGNGNLSLSTNIAVNNPSAVVASDVNGDGKLDLVCANVGSDSITILTNKGNGIFLKASAPAAGNRPEALIAVDVNNDTKPDLITANYYGYPDSNTLSVLTNDGFGNFVLACSPPVGGPGVGSVAAADINEDGKMDLISAGGGILTVFTNSGGSLFNFSSSPHVLGVQKVATADVNGDGHIDLITANMSYDTVSILTNDGKGNFVLSSSPSVLGGPGCLAVEDINGDGKPDLVVGTVFGSIYIDTGLTVLTNDGAGNFSIAIKFHAAGPEAITVGDLNGDGKLDIVSAEQALNRAGIFFQVPQLNVTQQTENILVSWSATWTNWVLQANANLSESNWLTINAVLNDGTNKSAATPVSSGNLFFRLLPQQSQ